MQLPHFLDRRQALVPVLALALTLAGCGGSVAATAATGSATSGGAATTSATASSATAATTAPTTTAAATSASVSPTDTSATTTTSAAPTGSTSSAASASTGSGATTSATATSSASAAAAGSAATTVVVRDDPKLGKLLTDPAGRTLYWFTKDKPGVSNCSGGCLKVWPAFTATGALTLPAGVPGTLGSVKLADGSSIVTYDDMPLYYYVKDTAPGDTTGQGVGKIWYVVPPTAGPLTAPAS